MINVMYAIRLWWWRRKYRTGVIISKFIARDIRRDVEVISDDKLELGILIVRERTNNILYNSSGLTTERSFGPIREVNISGLWKWSGSSWGGLENGKSIGDLYDLNIESAQQVDSAEASTIAVPPSGPSGSPR